jgi:hypothetical protein
MDDAWAILAVAILPTFLSAMAGVESYDTDFYGIIS